MVQKAMIAVVTAASVKIGFDWLVKSNANMETYKNTLSVVLKSEAKAIEALAWANKFAADTPFEIPQIIEATTRMSSYGLDAKKTMGIVGDMASVMGKDLMQAVEAVADAQTGEVERLKEFGITKTMIEEEAKRMKVTVTNNQGQITDQKAFNAVLFKIMEDRFKGGMELQSKTFWGMVSNAKDFVGNIGRTLGKPIFEGMKKQLKGLLAWMDRLSESGKLEKWAKGLGRLLWDAGAAFASFKKRAKLLITYVTSHIKDLYEKNKPFFDKLKVILGNVFTTLKTKGGETFDWLMNDVLPNTIDLLFDMGQKVIDVANYFIDNWSWIKPLVEGIALAFLVWGTYLGIVAAVTKVATAAQWLLNIALNANPMGLVVLAIGLLIGAGLLVAENWDFLKEKASDIWVGIKNTFKTGVNYVIEKLNWLIKKIRLVPGFGDTPLIAKMQMSKTTQQKQIDYAMKERKAMPMLSRAGTEAPPMLSRAVTEAPPRLSRAVTEAPPMLSRAVTEAPPTAKEASRLKQGITAGLPDLVGLKQGITAVDGIHANGLSYVPFDGYRAEVHKGEGILTAPENKAYRKGGSTIGTLIGRLIISGTDKDPSEIADAVIAKLYEKLSGADDVAGAEMGGLLSA